MGKNARSLIGFCGVAGFIMLYPFGVVLGAGLANFLLKMKYDSDNQKIEKENQRITAQNESLKAQEQPILQELKQVQNAYMEQLSSWYPDNYCFVEAAEFFYDCIKNYRADSMKEAINLYENTLHQRRVEANQKENIKQQKLNNILALGNLAMQAANFGAINNQTDAINNQTDAINRNTDAVRNRRYY